MFDNLKMYERPRTRGEVLGQIFFSLLLTAVVLAILTAVLSLEGILYEREQTGYGSYYPDTDNIWVRDNMSPAVEEQVRTHEEAHRSLDNSKFSFLFRTDAPFTYILVFLVALFLVSLHREFFYMAMGIFCPLLLATEIHAETVTVFTHGFGTWWVSLSNLSGYLALLVIPILAVRFFPTKLVKLLVIWDCGYEGVPRFIFDRGRWINFEGL